MRGAFATGSGWRAGEMVRTVAIGCQTCGNLNPERARACDYCGASLPATPAYADPFERRRASSPQAAVLSPPIAHRDFAGMSTPPKDPSAGLLIELLPGFFGFLGIGHLWAGETALGLALLLGYWAFWGIVVVATFLTLGLLLCFLPFLAILYFAAPIISAIALQRRLRARQALGAAPVAPPSAYPF